MAYQSEIFDKIYQTLLTRRSSQNTKYIKFCSEDRIEIQIANITDLLKKIDYTNDKKGKKVLGYTSVWQGCGYTKSMQSCIITSRSLMRIRKKQYIQDEHLPK